MRKRSKSTTRIVRNETEGLPGHLRTTDGETLPVRVFGSGGELLELVLMLQPGDELALGRRRLESEGGQLVGLEYATPKGVVRLHGSALPEEEDTVSFHVVGPSEIVQRRQFARVEVALPVTLADADGESLKTSALEISGGGMLLSGPEDLKQDSWFGFRLELEPGARPIEGRGRVVREAVDGTRGFAFEELSEADRERLVRFVFDCQRAELQRIRTERGSHRRAL